MSFIKLEKFTRKMDDMFTWRTLSTMVFFIAFTIIIFLILEMVQPGGGMMAGFIILLLVVAYIAAAVLGLLLKTVVLGNFLVKHFIKDEDWIKKHNKEFKNA